MLHQVAQSNAVVVYANIISCIGKYLFGRILQQVLHHMVQTYPIASNLSHQLVHPALKLLIFPFSRVDHLPMSLLIRHEQHGCLCHDNRRVSTRPCLFNQPRVYDTRVDELWRQHIDPDRKCWIEGRLQPPHDANSAVFGYRIIRHPEPLKSRRGCCYHYAACAVRLVLLLLHVVDGKICRVDCSFQVDINGSMVGLEKLAQLGELVVLVISRLSDALIKCQTYFGKLKRDG